MTVLPTFFAAKQLTERLRGFDLGDDPEQLSHCESLALADELSDAGFQFLGVLRYRAQRFEDAASAFLRASEMPDFALTGLFLAACAHMRAGQAEKALNLLDAMLEHEDLESEKDISVSGVHFARGDALWLKGSLDEAEEAYRTGLNAEPLAEAWLDIARLLEHKGKSKEALKAVKKAIEADENMADAHYFRAVLLAQKREIPGALEALEKACSLDAAAKESARGDARFDPIRQDSRFQDKIKTPDAPDLGWLKAFPAIVDMLGDPKLAALGISFVSEQDAQQGGEALIEHYAGTWHLGILWTDELWRACQSLSQGKRLLARGPTSRDLNGSETESQVYFDPSAPDRLYFAPSFEVPPIFWISVPANAEALHEAVSEFFPVRRIPKLGLPRVRRAFMGYQSQLVVPNPYSGELEQAGPHELDRHFAFSPFADSFVWGSAQPDDPWPERIPPQAGYSIKIVSYSRKMREQRKGATARFTRRTLFSRSQLTIEIHRGGLYVWEIRYRPSKHQAVMEQFNQQFGTSYPIDLPFDVIGALMGFDFALPEWLEERLAQQTDPGQIAAYLQVIAAARHCDLSVTDLLQKYTSHEAIQVRASIANVAIQYNWEFLLENMGSQETSPELLEFIDQVLGDGIAPQKFNELGEPIEGDDDGEDEEGDEEEDDEFDDEFDENEDENEEEPS